MSEIIGLVTKEEVRPNNGNAFYQFILKSESEVVKVCIWDLDKFDNALLPKKGDLIKLDLDKCKDQRTTKYNNIGASVDSFAIIKKEDNKDLVQKLREPLAVSQEDLQKAYKTITDKTIYKNIQVFEFVMNCLASLPKEKFLVCPAAKGVHHSLSGGLMTHTAEVLSICKGVVACFPYPAFIDSDLIFASAVLHDLGKVQTYHIDDLGEPASHVEEYSVGHAYYSLSLVEKISKNSKLDPEFISELMHSIAAHHGHPDFGAIKAAKTLEALILHQADNLSAKCGLIENKLKNIKESKGEVKDRYFWLDEDFITTRRMRAFING